MKRFWTWTGSSVLHVAAAAVIFWLGIEVLTPRPEADVAPAPPMLMSVVEPEAPAEVEFRRVWAPSPRLALHAPDLPMPREPHPAYEPPSVEPAPAAPEPKPPALDRPITLRRPPEHEGTAERTQAEVVGDMRAVEVHNPPPAYPTTARRRGVEGEVVVRVVVLADGRPGEASVVETSGSSMLDNAALDAVREWRFRPAMRGGRPVDSIERIRFVFRLRG